jgi:hypothetical protein
MTTVATTAAAAAAVAVEECMVCCEPYNKRNHTPVDCEYADCKYKVCIECVRAYLMTSTNEAHCMECKKVWTQDFIVKALKSTWVNGTYRQHKKKLLVDIEISKIPETMEAAARYKAWKSEENLLPPLKKEHEKLKTIISNSRKESNSDFEKWCDDVYYPKVLDKKNTTQEEISELRQEYVERDRVAKQKYIAKDRELNFNSMFLKNLQLLQDCKHRVRILKRQYLNAGAAAGDGAGAGDGAAGAAGEKEKKEKRVFTMPCPANECNGMLSTQYKCGICELFACPKCHEIIGEDKSVEHTCDPNNVASAEAIKKETKKCPGCPNRIFRIEGCSQMWCTGCHTAFDWNTGRVVKNDRLHNPHWIEYQRNKNNGQAPRAPGDVPCGGLITRYELDGLINRKISQGILLRLVYRMAKSYSTHDISNYITANNVGLCLTSVHKVIDEITRNSIRVIREELQHEQNFELVRCKYIVKEITKEQLSTYIHTMITKREKKTRLLHVYELISAVGIDVFNEIYNSQLEDEAYIQFISSKILELDALRVHCNNLFAQIGHNYNLSTPYIGEYWFCIFHDKCTQTRMKAIEKEKPTTDIQQMLLPSVVNRISNSDVITIISQRRNDFIDTVARTVETLTASTNLRKPEIESSEKDLIQLKLSLREKLSSGDGEITEINDRIREVEKEIIDFRESCKSLEKNKKIFEILMNTLDTIRDEVWEGGKYMKKP